MNYNIKVHTGECLTVDPDNMRLPFDIFYINHTQYGFSLKKQYYSPEMRALLFAEDHFNGLDGVWWVLKDYYSSPKDYLIQYRLI